MNECILVIGYLFAVFILFLVLLKVYVSQSLGKCHSAKMLHGKVALITGSSRGVGYYTALDLAKRGARVIITGTNLQTLQETQKQMVKESGNINIVAKHLDFLSLEEVRMFAKDIIDTELRLDILVNNVGTCGLGKTKTKDGLLAEMQVNYYGPFLLTNLLIGLLKQSNDSRIVNVGSAFSNIDIGFDVNNIENVKNSLKFAPLYEFFVYTNSKICVAHSTIEMAKRLQGSHVTANHLHPGVCRTELLKKVFFMRVVSFLIGSLYFKTPKQGAETSIHLAVCEKVAELTGKYFIDCRESHLWGDYSAATSQKVWEQTVHLVGLKPEEMFF